MTCILCQLTPARAQQYFFKNYSVESGLPFIQVSCMFQDSNGYLWSGGYGGLTRFDGKNFINFNRKNGLIDHNVNAICADARGAIFVGTSKGLSVLYGKTFKNFSAFKDYQNPVITSFCKGYHHSIYIGTQKGLYMYKNDEVNAVKKLEGYQINHLYNPDTTVIFIGTDKGLVIFGHNTFKVLNKATGIAGDRVTSVTRYKNNLVIGTTEGLTLFDLATYALTNYYIESGLIDENISAVAQDGDYLWVGSPSGLLRFDGKQFSYFNIGVDNNSNQVRCILKDREQNIWLGTHSGLFRYRDNSFSTFDKVGGLANSLIFQIFRDRHGSLWVCSQNNGIYKQTHTFFKRYGSREGVINNSSHAAIEDYQGRLLFGADGKLLQFSNERFSPISLPSEFKGVCEVLFEDSRNTLWIGGSQGFVSLDWKDGRPICHYYELPVDKEITVYGFCEDLDHNIYIGTFKGGLFKLTSGDSLINLSDQMNLNEETFFTLRYFNGHVFGASLNGVLDLDIKTGKLSRISDVDGLNSELVYSIEITRDGNNMWIGTNQGINKLNLKKYFARKKIEIVSFGKQEGFAGVECNSNGIWEDRDGTLWFGTVSGMVKHEPFNFKKNVVETKTLIQNIKLLNEDTMLRDGVVLPSDYNVISFYYRGICFTNPDRVLYQRKLVGLDRDWSNPSNEDFIKYTNLAPGNYTFKIRSSNNEGVWNEKETSFNFRIKSPFYLTWWFLLSAFITVFGLIYVFFMVRIYNIKKKQRLEFERRVEMSKIELKALRSQMNPHFIFNSLNSIQHYIFNTKSDEAIKYLNKFARLVRIILNNSERPTVTVGDDLEALKLYLELEQMRFEEKFEYEIIVDNSVDPDYDIMPPLLMQPYVENAILHGLNPKPVKGKLTIRLHSENNFLICTIADNGIGRDKASEIRRTMPIRNHKSLGMKITEDRLKILNEINNSQLSVTITDLKNDQGDALGTKVELFVPLNG